MARSDCFRPSWRTTSDEAAPGAVERAIRPAACAGCRPRARRSAAAVEQGSRSASSPPSHEREKVAMKALVYHGPGERSWESAPDPAILEPTDAIVRIDTSTICGTDLHILKGDVPEVKPGTILGHEAVGTVVEVGAAVTTVAAGDRVLVSCITLVRALPLLQGGPLRPLHRRGRLDLRPHDRRPAGRVRARAVRRHLGLQGAGGLSDEQVLFLADILPTAYEVGVLNGRRRARRHGRDRRRRPDRPGGDHDREAAHAGPDRRHRPRRRAAREGARVRRRRDDQQRQRGRRRPGHGADRTASAPTSRSRRSACPTRSSSAPS